MEAKHKIEKQNNIKDQWILCTSKKRGCKYLFNTATGESKWVTQDEVEKIYKKSPTSRKLRTPAQDRLKRLQKEIRAKNSVIEKPRKNLSQTQGKVKKTEETAKSEICVKNTPAAISCKKRKRNVEHLETQSAPLKPESTSEVAEKKAKRDENQTAVEKVFDTLSHLQSGVRQKIVKTIGKIRNVGQKSSDVKKIDHNDVNKTVAPKKLELQKFTIPKIAKPIEIAATTEVQKVIVPEVVNKISQDCTPATETVVIKEPTTTFPVRKGIANKRLEELREKLKAQLKETKNIVEEKNTLETSNENNNEVEPMDWEAIDKADEKEEQCTSIGYYNKNTINDSLLHFTNKQHAKTKQKWAKDFYYIIPDTNVWLNHLKFLDELSKMKLLETEGSMLYIPYIVIRELDGLKNRETLELRAKMAINYIHEQLKLDNMHLQTQSASEEKEHLISVDCPDDSIINCCLQVQRHVKHTMLLSEDTNLRNKANCNDIFSTTKSDLLSQHPT